MKKENIYRSAIIICSLVQIILSAVYLNTFSRIDNWSAVYAEDSKGYILASEYFMGRQINPENKALMRYRLFSPAMPFLASVMGRVMPVERAFAAINILLWLAAALVFYEFLKIILYDRPSAFSGAVIFTTSLPLIEWGLPVMVDMAAYFFAVLIFFIFIRMRDRSPYRVMLYGVLIALGILVKPTLLVLLIFVLLCMIMEGRYKEIFILLICSIVPVCAVYHFLGLDIDAFKTFGTPRHRGMVYLFLSAAFCFHWGWFFLFKSGHVLQPVKKYMLIYLAVFFSAYLVFVHNPRLFFLSFPAVIPFIINGIRSICPKLKKLVIVMCCYVVTSNGLAIFHLYVMRTVKIRDVESLRMYLITGVKSLLLNW